MTSVLDLAQALIRINTINPPGSEEAAAKLLAGRLEEAGFTVKLHWLERGRPSVVARSPGRGDRPVLCMTGHLDTVPLGGAQWSHDPLAAECDGDRLVGRGSSDMKGGVAAIVVAIERIAGLGREMAGLEVVLTVGEESGCDGARALVRTPGALRSADAIVVAEPTSNYPHIGHKGALWLRGKTAGVSAHGSRPDLGVNAIYKLARAIAKLEGHTIGQTHELLGDPTLNLGTVKGGSSVNLVPDQASIGIDIRTVPDEPAARTVAKLRELLGEEVVLETLLELPPVLGDPADPWIQETFEVMGPLIGDVPGPQTLAYFTDAAVLAPAFGDSPVIICGPGDAEQAHQTNESCSLTKLDIAVEGFTEIAKRWCGF